jgi:hypothetical protein
VLAYGPSCCGEVARGGCSITWNLRVTISAIFSELETRIRTNTTPRLCLLLAYRLKTLQVKNRALLYMLQGLFSPGLKRAGCVAEHLALCSAEL